MKITPFTKDNFQELFQLNKIEYLLRKSVVVQNIKNSIPLFETVAMLVVLAYSRLHSLLVYSAFGLNQITISLVNYFSIFFNTIIVLLFISFISRIIIYFQKHKQLSRLHEEFLNKLKIQDLTKIKDSVNTKIQKVSGK